MSTTDLHAPGLSDAELISVVREGDVAAYGALFSRHVAAATHLARLLVNGTDADDLVSEAFVKVLNVLLDGGGPDVAFRAYLLTAVRRLHIDKVRSAQRLTTTDDLTRFDPGVPFTDTAVAGFEGGAAARAFASLPERWQLVLWHLEVENQKPAEIAPLLGISPNSVSALAYRAREGLRQAFLNMHSGDLVSDVCHETHALLGGHVRGALSRRDGVKVQEHLDHCRRCTAAYLELCEVNSSLAGVLGPALLGSAAAGYLGGAGVASTGLGAAALALVGRGKEVALAHLSATTATAATVAIAGVVGVTTITVLDRGPGQDAPSGQPQGGSPSSAFAEDSQPAAVKRRAAPEERTGTPRTRAGLVAEPPAGASAADSDSDPAVQPATTAEESLSADQASRAEAGTEPGGAPDQAPDQAPGAETPPPDTPAPQTPPATDNPPPGGPADPDDAGKPSEKGKGHGKGRGVGHLLGHLLGGAPVHDGDEAPDAGWVDPRGGSGHTG